MTDPTLYTAALSEFPFTRAIRRDLHQNPELGFQEVRTAGIVSKELTNLGLEVVTGIARTGVVGILQGSLPGPVVLARFDMDALPIQEETGAEYASQAAGKMHACGHDGHVAIGLTTARLLARGKDQIKGSIMLVFQPAEEGLGGARKMLEEGVLKIGPKPDFALGLHVWNEKPLGWLAAAPGPLMAGAEIFWMRISGKGGHGAQPHQTKDPIAAAVQWISAVQTVVSRNVGPLESAVVSVTSVHGGDAFNVIPQSVELQGTIRTFDPVVRQMVIDRFKSTLYGIVESMGCTVELKLERLTPAVINDPWVTSIVQGAARDVLPGHTIVTAYQTMGSEDMAEFLEEIPGCYLMIGSANPEKGLDAGHHHPKFDFDEDVLPQAAALMAGAILRLTSTEK